MNEKIGELELNKIYCEDALELLKKIPDKSVDSIVTDPPAGIEFMGKEWDSFKENKRSKGWACQGKEGGDDFGGFGKKLRPAFCSQTNQDLLTFQNFICQVFTEAIRVIKPGGYALVWAIPRTSHHTAMGLERAGFEVRDCVYHVFGSGFPKSMDISQDFDRQACREQLEKELGRKPTKNEFKEAWKSFRKVIGKQNYSMPKADNSIQANSYGISGGSLKNGVTAERVIADLTEPVTLEAKEWEGWGTALKPAVECWWLVRKPLSEKTVAENCLKWGTGGINIEGCRVGHNEPVKTANREQRKAGWNPDNCGFDSTQNIVASANPQGRFPSNLIHDGSDEVVSLFPNSSITGKRNKPHLKHEAKNTPFTMGNPLAEYTDSGSASRFFYCAKASKRERNRGCEELEEKPIEIQQPHNSKNLEERYAMTSKNNHPTVKSLELMKYLIKLITPKKGIVLDMFAGSGSTLIAAKYLGYNFIGIEISEEYVDIANKRLSQGVLNL